MKQLFFYCLFLLFSCVCYTQNTLQISGMGTSINNNTSYSNYYDIDNPREVYKNKYYAPCLYAQKFYQIKNGSFYLITGTKLSNTGGYFINRYFTPQFIFAKRLGFGFYHHNNKNVKIYYSVGGEVNNIGYGLFSNVNILFRLGKQYFSVFPEIAVNYNHYYASLSNLYTNYTVIAGCGIGLAKEGKIAYKENTSKYNNKHHFYANFSIGNINTMSNYNKPLSYAKNYYHISAGYRIFAKKVISPDIGIGFISQYNESKYSYMDYFYEKSQDYIPYIKAGVSLETRGRFAFIGNIAVFKALPFTGFGFTTKIGLKYAASKKIAVSICPEITQYDGIFWGSYAQYKTDENYNIINLDKVSNKTHYTIYDGVIPSINLGVHF